VFIFGLTLTLGSPFLRLALLLQKHAQTFRQRLLVGLLPQRARALW
jgi:hypothetical protein